MGFVLRKRPAQCIGRFFCATGSGHGALTSHMFTSEKKLLAELMRCKAECAFVKNAFTMSPYDPFCYTELVYELHPYLPADRWTLTIEKSRFSTELVRDMYESLVVEFLQNGYELAAKLARPVAKGR